jgi:hypothetical protein
MKNREMRGLSPHRWVRWSCGAAASLASLFVVSAVSATPTTNTGQAYVDECAASGVPIPPPLRYEDAFHNQNGTQWVNAGILENEFTAPGLVADVFYSETPDGVCVALPRSTQSAGPGTIPDNIDLLGVICQGVTSSKACFWDRANSSPFDTLDVLDFRGAAELTDVCTDCHRGENAYIIHPNTPLGDIPNRWPDNWYDPIVLASFPQNPGPTTLFDTGWDLTESCLGCHSNSSGGRFPAVNNTTTSYCDILKKAFGNTMPLPIPAGATPEAHPPYQALLDACDPGSMEGMKMMSFDDPDAGDWKADRGTLSFVSGNQTEGTGALRVNSSGYVRIDSIPFASWTIPMIGTRLDLDVYVPPAGQPNKYWLGTVQLYVTIPSKSMFNAYVGQVELTPAGTGWRTTQFTLPSAIQSALLEAHPDVRFGIATNTPNGAPPLRLDKLRFAGTLSNSAVPPASLLQYDFEHGSDWEGIQGAVVSLERTTERSFAGFQSLEADLIGPTLNGGAFTEPVVEPAAGQIFWVRVYIPAGAPVNGITPYVKDGADVFTDTWNANLPRDRWLALGMKVPATTTLPLKELGVKVYLTAPYDGPIFIDAVQW